MLLPCSVSNGPSRLRTSCSFKLSLTGAWRILCSWWGADSISSAADEFSHTPSQSEQPWWATGGAQWLWAATMDQQLPGVLDAGDICLHSVSQFSKADDQWTVSEMDWNPKVLREGGERDLSFYSSNLFRCCAFNTPLIFSSLHRGCSVPYNIRVKSHFFILMWC